mmetsp:Transcript_79532/g.145509  ORF Transcript_79532/g.145509 Transcript_79532/m.145509 type:complete len:205 (+) Transcript_79532:86-700(+)
MRTAALLLGCFVCAGQALASVPEHEDSLKPLQELLLALQPEAWVPMPGAAPTSGPAIMPRAAPVMRTIYGQKTRGEMKRLCWSMSSAEDIKENLLNHRVEHKLLKMRWSQRWMMRRFFQMACDKYGVELPKEFASWHLPKGQKKTKTGFTYYCPKKPGETEIFQRYNRYTPGPKYELRGCGLVLRGDPYRQRSGGRPKKNGYGR